MTEVFKVVVWVQSKNDRSTVDLINTWCKTQEIYNQDTQLCCKVRYINPHAHICVVNIKTLMARNVWANPFTVISWIKHQPDVLCLKILKILFTLFGSTCFRYPCVHHQELLSCTCSLWSRVVLGSLCPPVLLCCKLQHSRTGRHNEPSTTRDQRLHVQLRSSWWWTQGCPKHVERNNVNKF